MKQDITMPIELAYNLSLDEMGVIFVLLSSPYLEEETQRKWTDNDHFQMVLKTLRDRKIVTNNDVGEIDIDITKVDFEKIIDGNGNTCYSYGGYKLFPVLRNDEIFYSIFDRNWIDLNWLYYELEEAKQKVRELIKNE